MPRIQNFDEINQNTPVLIAGQTASGKSQLALEIAKKHGGIIINADAIQVYKNWKILTARPSSKDEAKIKHKLYGHVGGASEYSVGTWIKEIKEILSSNSRPIIVGGTGLYFSALTNGLVDIPEISESIRQEANNRIKKNGFESLIGEIDEETVKKIDKNNIKAVSYSNNLKPEIKEIHKKLNVKEYIKMKSSLKFCVVATGEYQIYVAEPRAHEWDIAAGHAILKNSGGTVTDFEGNNISYGKDGFKNPSIILKSTESI